MVEVGRRTSTLVSKKDQPSSLSPKKEKKKKLSKTALPRPSNGQYSQKDGDISTNSQLQKQSNLFHPPVGSEDANTENIPLKVVQDYIKDHGSDFKIRKISIASKQQNKSTEKFADEAASIQSEQKAMQPIEGKENSRNHIDINDLLKEGNKGEQLAMTQQEVLVSHRSVGSSSHLSFQSDSSVSQKNTRGPSLPPPNPLWDGEGQDDAPNNTGFRRATKLFKTSFLTDDFAKGCAHTDVSDWICDSCHKNVAQFDIIFDDFQGRCSKFIKICYENLFLQEFLGQQLIEFEQLAIQEQRLGTNAQTKNATCSDSENEVNQDGNNVAPKRNPEIVYACYQPLNVTEMREYMLFCMSRDIQSSNIMREALLLQTQDQDQKTKDDQKTDDPFGFNAKTRGLAEIPEEDCDHNTDLDAKLKRLKSTYFIPYALDASLGTGQVKNLSLRLTKYMKEFDERQNFLVKKYNGDVLLFDTIFESGNLLRADRITKSEYRMYMQVDTNTKGHQQWFYFRVMNTRKNRKYLFKIMNFTKPGITGGSGYRKSELFQRVMYKAQKSNQTEWSSVGPDKLEFVKTKVQRKKKDVLAGGGDSDQEDWIEEAYGQDQNNGPQTNFNEDNREMTGVANEKTSSLKKKKKFFYYSLEFEFEFEHDEDIVFFAFSQPYTFCQTFSDILRIEKNIKPSQSSQVQVLQIKTSGIKQVEKAQNVAAVQTSTLRQGTFKLEKDVKEAKDDKDKEKDKEKDATPKNGPLPIAGISFENKSQMIYYKRTELCRTICGLPLWQITISKEQRNAKKKPTIIISSRVHAGETPASIVFAGILEFLTSDKKEAKFLRKFYTFVLIPILNPDGVVCGNYRSSITGVDLNRQWILPDPEFHAEVFALKSQFKHISEVEKRQIWIYCDIHGHSKKKNSFFYGCNTAANGGFLSWTIVRLLPRIFAQKTHLFHYKDCRFKVEPYKIGTGRVVAWKQFAITHSFTLENSFYGFDFGEDETKEFSQEEYLNVGIKLCESIYELYFVWKQIRRELQITNGWLKPKVLLEKTGVPAAQVLQEELARKKKDELKNLAIQQYQTYLKKFYAGKGAVINPLSKTEGLQVQTNPSQVAVQTMAFGKVPGSKNSLQSSIQKGSGKIQQSQQSPTIKHRSGDETETSSLDMYGKSRNPLQRGTGESQLNSKHERSMINADLIGLRPNSSHIHMQHDNKKGERKSQMSFDSEDNEDSSAFAIYRSLQGLVKLQALVRGIQTRKRIKKLLLNRKKKGLVLKHFRVENKQGTKLLGQPIERHQSSHAFIDSIKQDLSKPGLASYRDGIDNQTDTESNLDRELLDFQKFRNPIQDSKDSLSNSNFERMSSKPAELLQRDWRTYFQETELNHAFQRVEIEHREISEEGSSAGSSSNPSEDNFEEEELAGKIYNLSEQKAQLFKQEKQEEQKTFSHSVNNQIQVSGQQIFSKITSKLNQIVLNIVDVQLATHSQSPEKRQNVIELNEKLRKESTPYQGLQNQQNSVKANKLQASGGILAQQTIGKRLQSAQSPPNLIDQYNNQDYHLQNQNIAFHQIHGKSLLVPKDQFRHTKQARATTSHQNGISSSQTNNQFQGVSGYFQGYQTAIGQNVRNFNYKGNFAKKENINQVIKDCFITKKFGIKKPQNSTSQAINATATYKTQNGGKQNVNPDYSHNYKLANPGSSSKKNRKLKRHKSPMNMFQNPNQVLRQNLGNESFPSQVGIQNQYGFIQPMNKKLASHIALKQAQMLHLQAQNLQNQDISYDFYIHNSGFHPIEPQFMQTGVNPQISYNEKRLRDERLAQNSSSMLAREMSQQNNLDVQQIRSQMQQYVNTEEMSGRKKPINLTPFNSIPNQTSNSFNMTFQNGSRQMSKMSHGPYQHKISNQENHSNLTQFQQLKQAWQSQRPLAETFNGEEQISQDKSLNHKSKRAPESKYPHFQQPNTLLQVQSYQPIGANQKAASGFDETPSVKKIKAQQLAMQQLEMQNLMSQTGKEQHFTKMQLPNIGTFSLSTDFGDGLKPQFVAQNTMQQDPYAMGDKIYRTQLMKETHFQGIAQPIANPQIPIGSNYGSNNQPYGTAGSSLDIGERLDNSMCNTGSMQNIQTVQQQQKRLVTDSPHNLNNSNLQLNSSFENAKPLNGMQTATKLTSDNIFRHLQTPNLAKEAQSRHAQQIGNQGFAQMRAQTSAGNQRFVPQQQNPKTHLPNQHQAVLEGNQHVVNNIKNIYKDIKREKNIPQFMHPNQNMRVGSAYSRSFVQGSSVQNQRVAGQQMSNPSNYLQSQQPSSSHIIAQGQAKPVSLNIPQNITEIQRVQSSVRGSKQLQGGQQRMGMDSPKTLNQSAVERIKSQRASGISLATNQMTSTLGVKAGVPPKTSSQQFGSHLVTTQQYRENQGAALNNSVNKPSKHSK